MRNEKLEQTIASMSDLELRELVIAGLFITPTPGVFSVTNDGTKTTLATLAGDYWRFGDAGTTSHSLNTNDDVLFTGKTEFDGKAYFDANVDVRSPSFVFYLNSNLKFNDDVFANFGTSSDWKLGYENADSDARVLLLTCDLSDDPGDNAPVLVLAEFAARNVNLGFFDSHADNGEPTYAVLNLVADAYASLDSGDINATTFGLRFQAAGDEDIEIINLPNTGGTPRVFWDESEDAFWFTPFIKAANVSVLDAGGYYDATEVESTLQEVGQELLQHNLAGFEDASSVALSTDSGTPPTITLTFTGTVAWWDTGVRYTDTGTDNITLADTSGTHLIYYNGATLSEVVNPTHAQTDSVWVNNAPVALVYWETNTNTTPVLARETHGIIMSSETHHYLHDTRGARWFSGANISAYTLNTATDAAVSFDLTDLKFYDEDIEIDVTDGVAANQYEQVLTGDAEIPVLYRDDVDGSWIEQAASTLPYLVGGTPRIQYMNDDGDGTWSRTEVSAAKFCLYFLIATNDWQTPIKMVPGAAQYNTKNAALDGLNTELVNLGDLPSAEFILLYAFVMQASSGGTTNAKIIEIADYRQANISATTAVAATDHGALTGLGDDDHTQYALNERALRFALCS